VTSHSFSIPRIKSRSGYNGLDMVDSKHGVVFRPLVNFAQHICTKYQREPFDVEQP
jgi:hypothetical protein